LNFKFYILFISLVILCGCGVKAKPITPPEKAINSYIDSYTGTNQTLIAPNPTEKKKR